MKSADSKQLFVPGRLCLFGEHSDWASEFGLHSGYCIVVGTDQGLHATARACNEFIVEGPTVHEHPEDRSTDVESTTTVGQSPGTAVPGLSAPEMLRLPWHSDALLQAAADQEEFFRYTAGVACLMREHRGVRGGIHLTIAPFDLPLKKGVSSSAAVCILVAKAFNAVYDLNLLPHELMELAYQGEKLTGSRCGRMDQACIYGKTPVLLTFAPPAVPRVEPVFPARAIEMFFVDMAGQKDTVAILSDLRHAYELHPRLQRALGADNEQIVREAYAALEAGNAARLGDLMNEAQRLFDAHVAPHSPHLASPLLHKLLSQEELQGLVLGGKGVGSQGDGTAQFVARSAAARDIATAFIQRTFPHMRCFALTIPAGGT